MLLAAAAVVMVVTDGSIEASEPQLSALPVAQKKTFEDVEKNREAQRASSGIYGVGRCV